MILMLLCSIAMAAGTASEDARALVLGFAKYGDDQTPARTQPWWTGLDDQGLHDVLKIGLNESPVLQTADARIDLASAATWQSLSGLLPQIAFEAATQQAPTDAMSLSPYSAGAPDYGEAFQSMGALLADVAAATGTDPSSLPDFSGGEQTTTPDTYRQSSTLLKGSWTVDVFGRQTLSTLAAQRDTKAAHLGRDANMRTLAGQLGTAWYDLVAAREQATVVKRQVATARSLLEIVQMRYERGEGSALDVLQQRQQLAGTEALLPLAEAGRRSAHGRLAVALGRSPSTQLPDSAGWPDLGPAPVVGSPRRLIDDRADIQVAIQQLEGARLKRAASFSALAPTFTLTGQVGRQYLTFDETDSVATWGLGAVATMPLFAGGRTHAGIKAARASRDIANISLRTTVLNAVNQVENAIALEKATADTLKARQHQAEAARHALDESRTHYTQGLAPYVTVLAALAAHQAAELALLDGERGRIQARIQLHTALGGQWRSMPEDAP
jgi:outer membrane protein, multidrug efflux system